MHPFTKALVHVSLLAPIAALTALGCSSASTPAFGEDSGAPQTPLLDGGSADASSKDVATADASPTPVEVQVHVQGSLDGKPFAAKGAAARTFGWKAEGGQTQPALSFVIGEYPAMCAAACVKGSTTLFFYLRGKGKAFDPFPLGTYAIVDEYTIGGTGPAPQGTVVASPLILGCDLLSIPQFATGSVTITASTETSVTGTFNLTSASSGPLTGSFTVPLCAVADSQSCDAREQSGTSSVACNL